LGAISTLVGVNDDRMGEAETLSGEVSISAIDALFSGHPKGIGVRSCNHTFYVIGYFHGETVTN
jgi:hypothetical protein